MALQIFKLSYERLGYAVAVVAITLIARFLANFYKARSRFWRLKKQGLVSNSPRSGALT